MVTNKEDSRAKSAFVNAINNLNKIRDSLLLNLDFNGQESSFYVDRVTDLGLSNERGYNSVIKTFKTYYRNNNTDTLLMGVVSDKYYLVSSLISSINWKIGTEKKKIGKYLCTRATTKIEDKHPTKGVYTKTIEAWFSTEIPINIGPNNYGGLPGLIMELKEGKFTYYVQNINLNPEAEIKISKPQNGNVITKQEYFDLIPTITKENIKDYIGN